MLKRSESFLTHLQFFTVGKEAVCLKAIFDSHSNAEAHEGRRQCTGSEVCDDAPDEVILKHTFVKYVLSQQGSKPSLPLWGDL